MLRVNKLEIKPQRLISYLNFIMIHGEFERDGNEMKKILTQFDDVSVYIGQKSDYQQMVIVNVGDIAVSIVFGKDVNSGSVYLFDENNESFLNLERSDIA